MFQLGLGDSHNREIRCAIRADISQQRLDTLACAESGSEVLDTGNYDVMVVLLDAHQQRSSPEVHEGIGIKFLTLLHSPQDGSTSMWNGTK